MFAGGMYGADAYSPWEAEFSSMNDSSAWGTQFSGAAPYQHLTPSCGYCEGDHLLELCPHNSDSPWFVGSMHDSYPNNYSQGCSQHAEWEGQGCATTQYAEPIGPPISYFEEQWQPQLQLQQQHFEQPQQQDSYSMEDLMREFMAKQDYVLQSQAASFRSLEIQFEHVANELKIRIQEEEEQREAIRLAELRSSKHTMFDEEIAELPIAVAAAHARARLLACSPDAVVAVALAPAAPDVLEHACPENSGNTFAPAKSNDHAIARDCASKNTDFPAPTEFEEPASTGTEGDAAPALTTPPLTNRSDTEPDRKDVVLMKADDPVFPSNFMILDFEEGKEVPSIMEYIGNPAEPSESFAMQELKEMRPEFNKRKNDDRQGAEPLKRVPKKKRAYSFLSPVD